METPATGVSRREAFERSRRADEYDAAMSEATPLWDAWEDAQK